MLTAFDSATSDLGWRTVNDNVMGGRSKGGFRVESGTLVFEGSTNTNGGGFSSIRSSARDFGLSGADGVRLRVRGDGRTYTFRLATSTTRASYWAEFKTKSDGDWEEIRIPFERFRPRWRGQALSGPKLDRANIVGVGLMIYDKRDGPFRLEVDWIKADRLSLERYEGRHRPLVVFAPTADDERLLKQKELVAEARGGFDERDMVLIAVVEGGESLRKRFGIAPGAFAVRLIGKDGGVKRSADEPVAMQALFDQIDRMPMRRAEMGR